MKLLEEIDLSENNFTYIPSLIFKLDKLRKANLNFNNIKEFEIMEDEKKKYLIPPETKKFSIKYLYLAKNSIENLPYEIMMRGYLDEIEHMTLAENPIRMPSKELLARIKNKFINKLTVSYLNEAENKDDEGERKIESNLVSATRGKFKLLFTTFKLGMGLKNLYYLL